MINVCENCGEYRVDKIVVADESVAVCPNCQHRNPFVVRPLFFVCGASGTGKTTACRLLMQNFHETVNLDADILWRDELSVVENDCNLFYNMWLRVSKNIAQAGRSVVIFNAGAIPENVEACEERRYFSEIHYLALVCDDDALRERLLERPAWRNCSDEAFIQSQIAYNAWLKQKAQTFENLNLLDTSNISTDATYSGITKWIQERL